MDISRHPLLEKGYETCLAIEAISASEQQSLASQKASDLLRETEKLISSLPPKIGQPWHGQGGIFVGTQRNPLTGETRHTIMHPDALPANPWGTYGEDVPGTDYWDGAANTAAMRASGHCEEIITALNALPQVDGHNDYVIASQAQQNLITANVRDMVEPVDHWTSTQYSAFSAWNQCCENGGQTINFKDDRLAARAVRSILVIE